MEVCLGRQGLCCNVKGGGGERGLRSNADDFNGSGLESLQNQVY